jgi:polyisoprenoid-binding protein YceI
MTVDMTSVTSDQSRRDGQFTGRIMETAEHPTGTFRLTAPIELGSEPAVGSTVTAKATGDLTLKGVTRPVTFDVAVKRADASVAVSGAVPVTFSDYGIDNPSIGGFVSVGDTGTVEFLLVLTKG